MNMDKAPKSKASFFAEFWSFVANNKRYWITPIVIIILVLAAFILFTESSALAPFIYDIF
jgi:hypothetical protein